MSLEAYHVIKVVNNTYEGSQLKFPPACSAMLLRRSDSRVANLTPDCVGSKVELRLG